MQKQLTEIIQYMQSIKERKQRDWTLQIWAKLASFVECQDTEYCEKATVLSHFINEIANYMLEGDWKDYNGVGMEDDYDIENICNIASSFIENYITDKNTLATISEIRQYLQNVKVFFDADLVTTYADYDIFHDFMDEDVTVESRIEKALLSGNSISSDYYQIFTIDGTFFLVKYFDSSEHFRKITMSEICEKIPYSDIQPII